MVDTAITLYNWRHRYLVDETSLQNMQTALVDLPRGTFEGLTGAAVLKGFEASLPGGLQVAAASGIAVAASGYLDAVGTSTTLTLTAPASGTQKCLIVVSPNPTPQNPIPDPMNANSTWNLQTLQAAVVKVITGVASNSAPAYPSKGDNDTILFGVRLVAGQVSLASTDLDYNVRETIGKNSQINQNVNRHDDRLRPYTGGLATGLLGIKPSQLPAPNPPCFSHVVQGQPSIFPKASGGAYNGDAGDTFLNFKTGAITGADQSTSAFTPTVPTAGNSIVASVGITASDTLVVAYGVQGTRAQCLAGIKNQQTTGAGAVTILTQAKLLSFVVVTSSDGTNVTELDYVDARGTGTLDSSSTLPTAEMVQASATILATTGSTTSGSPSVTSVPLSQATTGSTIAGSRLVSTLGSMAGVFVGAAVTGSGIPAGTLVQAVGGSTAVLSQAATATASGVALTFSFIVPTGAAVSGTGIPASTYVSASSGTTVTLSQNATATASGVALTFSHTLATAADAQAQLDQLDSELNAVELGLRSISPKITTATLVEQATPSSNPAAGLLYLYSKNGDVLATKNSAGTESIVGSGSGAKNYLQASSNTSAGWTAFGNVAASTETTPGNLPRASTTQTGWKLLPSGSAQGTCTVSLAIAAVITATGHGLKTGMIVFFTTTGTLPSGITAGTAYYVTVIDANTYKLSTTMTNLIAGTFVSTFGGSQSGTHSFYYGGGLLRFTLDAADYSTMLGLQHAQNILSGATGDWEIDAYSNTASDYSGTYTRLTLTTDIASSLQSALPNLEGTFRSAFFSSTSASPYIEIRFNKLANNTHGLVGSDLIVGPGSTLQAPYVGPKTAFTPSVTDPSATISALVDEGSYFVRYGDHMFLNVSCTFTTSVATPTDPRVAIPSGLTNGLTGGRVEGSGDFFNLLSDRFGGVPQITFGNAYVDVIPHTSVTFNGVGTNRSMRLSIMFPIAEWAGSGTINVGQNDVQRASNSNATSTATDTTSFAYGSAGSSIPNGAVGTQYSRRVRFQYPVPAGVTPILKVQESASGSWIALSDRLGPFTTQGTNSYGVLVAQVAGSSTDFDVVFQAGGIRGSNATYAGNGAAWSTLTTWNWMLEAPNPGAAVGFGAATDTSLGLVKLPTGYTQTTVADYQTDDATLGAVTWQGNGAGSTGSSAIAVRVTRNGRMITVSIPSLTTVIPAGTTQHIDSNIALPTWARPSLAWQGPAWVYNANGTWSVGVVNITTTGFIQFYRDQASTAFTAGSNAGWATISFTYPIN